MLLALLSRYAAQPLVLRAFPTGTEGSPHAFPSRVCTSDTHHVPKLPDHGTWLVWLGRG